MAPLFLRAFFLRAFLAMLHSLLVTSGDGDDASRLGRRGWEAVGAARR